VRNYNIKYCEGSYNKKKIKEKLIKKARNESEAMHRLYEQIQGIFITAIEERKL